MICLDLVKACSNADCRLVLPADPADEANAGFWVAKRTDAGRVYRFKTKCKTCTVRYVRERAEKKKGRPVVPRPNLTRLVERDGQLVQWRECRTPGCNTAGFCDDSPDCSFRVKTRDGNGKPLKWHGVCIKCLRERGRTGHQRRQDAENARRRELYRQRVLYDPSYRDVLRAYGRERYANSERRREQVRFYQAQRKLRDPEGVRESDRLYRALRAERDGRKRRVGKPSVIDGTAPRIPVEPFREWLVAYALLVKFDPERDREPLARDLGMEPKRVRQILSGTSRNVVVDIVDRALVMASRVAEVRGQQITRIDDLYPDVEIRG